MSQMSKIIKTKLVTFTVEALARNLARPSTLKDAAPKAGERKDAKKGAPAKPAPVVDAAPAWAKRSSKDPKTGEETPLAAATVHKQWPAHVKFDKGLQVAVAKSWAVSSMHLLSTAVPQYDHNKDILVVKRGAAVEVWTRRDFKKHDIVFAPVSALVKDHYWTRGRSVLLQGGSALHPSHKHFVMERNPSVAEDEDYTFSLFWATERTNDSSEANLHLEYPQVEISASVKLPNAVVADATHAAALVPPVLTNKTPVAKCTRLVAINDLNLQKIDEEKEKKRKQERLDAASAAKKPRHT